MPVTGLQTFVVPQASIPPHVAGGGGGGDDTEIQSYPLQYSKFGHVPQLVPQHGSLPHACPPAQHDVQELEPGGVPEMHIPSLHTCVGGQLASAGQVLHVSPTSLMPFPHNPPGQSAGQLADVSP